MRPVRYVALLVASGVTLVAQAPPSEPSVVAKNIYAAITAAATLRPAALIALDPSLPIDTSAADVAASQARIAELSDTIPLGRWVHSPSASTVKDVVSFIAANGEFAGSGGQAVSGLTPEEQELLFVDGDANRPSAEFQAFVDLNKRLRDAEQALKTEKDERRRAQFELEEADATQRLNSLRRLVAIGRAARKLTPASSTRTSFSKEGIQKALLAYRGPSFSPALDRWNDASGWVRLDISLGNHADDPAFASLPSSLRQSWWTPATAQKLLGNRATRISFEIKRIQVNRQGLDLSFLAARNWKLRDGGLISDGKLLTDGQAPSGRMPLLVSGLLLVRNVSITTRLSAALQRQLLTTIQKEGLRFGTLALAGDYVVPDTGARFIPALGPRGVSSPEIQVLAVLCDQIARAPNPDAALK